MVPVAFVLILAATLAGVTVLAVVAWVCYTAYLNWYERRLERRKGIYRSLVEDLALGDREALDEEIHRPGTLHDLEAFEAALEEQARITTDRPAWLLETYDRLGLIDKYTERLRTARRWRERALAAELLGRVGNAKAVPALLETIRATRTEDSDVRDIALRALARIGDSRSIPPLVDALETAEGWLAPHLADILMRHGESAVEPVLALLERPAPSRARAWAANLLGELRAESALPALLRSLDDSDDEVRAKSAAALGRIGHESAAQPLLERLLADPAPFVRARIASALGQFHDPGVTDRLVHALGDPAWWVRVRSVEALERIGPDAEQPLMLALDSGDAEIRRRAAVTLERLGAADTLAAAVRNEESTGDAARTLAKFSSVGARALLADLLVAPVAATREATLKALRRAGRRDFAPEIGQVALADPEPGLRSAALDLLARFRVPVATTIALEVERNDSDPGVRAAAIRALARQGSEGARRVVAAGLGSPAAEVRAASVEECARLDLDAANTRILEMLHEDPSSLVRERAALAVALLQVTGGESALLAASLRPEPATVHAAAVLGIGMFDQESMVARLTEVPESAEVRAVLRDRLRHDPWYRLLGCRLPASRRPELRALTTHTTEAAGAALASGMDQVLDPTGRVRLIGGLRALRGEEGREALIEAARRDPSPEARTAALAALGEMLDEPQLLDLAGEALADPSLLVRRAAVGLFSKIPPDKGLSVLVRGLRPGDDPTVFTAASEALAPSFREFADFALRMHDDGDEALSVVQIARRLNHPDLPRLLPVLARSRSPEVREAIASLWVARPETADAASLAALTLDPAAGVRRTAARAAGAIRSWSLLDRMASDPDALVRREVALAIGASAERPSAAGATLDTLSLDGAMPVRAAAYVARLLQGVPVTLPPGIEPLEAATALRDAADLPALREIARTAADENHRLAAGLALALLQDQVAHELARTDPFPSVRHRVGGALELAASRLDDA